MIDEALDANYPVVIHGFSSFADSYSHRRG